MRQTVTRAEQKNSPVGPSALTPKSGPKSGSEPAGPMQCNASAEAISFYSICHSHPGLSTHIFCHF